jgi:DNA-binding NarL/FixJ family response regulator
VTTVMLVSEEPLTCRALRNVIAAHAGLTTVGEASDATDALVLAEDLSPDLVVIDLALNSTDPVRLIRILGQRFPYMGVLALCSQQDDPRALGAIAVGAGGCALKNGPETDFFTAVRRVADGEFWIAPRTLEHLVEDYRRLSQAVVEEATVSPSPTFLHLREHERRTLLLLASGLSNKEIARQQGVALSTVKNTLTSVFAKIGVRHRSAAAAFAHTHGLVAKGLSQRTSRLRAGA